MRRAAGTFCVLLLFASFPAAGQTRCQTDTDPDHADWHEGHRELMELREGILRWMQRAGVEEPAGVITARSDSLSDRIQIELLDLPTSDEVELQIRTLVHDFLTANSDRNSFSIDLAAPATPLWPDSTVYCQPAMQNIRTVRNAMKTIATEAELDGERRALLWVLVDRRGRVDEIRVREETDVPSIDRYLRALGRALEFEPATRNGVPVSIWIAQGLTFQSR